MTKEIWKPVKTFETKYEISNLGNLKNIRTNKILKMTNKKKDYFRIILYDENHKRTTYIHRLVAETFIPNPNNFPIINHIDLNKQNNRVDNLEWCTQSHNTKDAISKGAKTMSGFNKYNKNKFNNKYGKLYQYDMKNNLINTFNNLEEAYIDTGVCKRNILQVINKQEGRKQAGGYIWKCEKRGDLNEV